MGGNHCINSKPPILRGMSIGHQKDVICEYISTSKSEHIYLINSAHSAKYEFVISCLYTSSKGNTESGILLSLIRLHVFAALSKKPQGEGDLNSDSWTPQTQDLRALSDPILGELEASWFSFPTLVFK